MKIDTKQNGTALTIALEGRLDTTTAPELESMARSALSGVKQLTIDMAGIDYISSAGLRVLLSMQKTMSRQGEMALIGVNETVREVFDMTGFSDIMTIR